jgi:predicted nucleic acid-binding protein
VARPKNPRSFYFDTCAVLRWIGGDEGHEPLARVIEAVDAGQVELYISAILIVEARGERRGEPVDEQRESRLRGLFDNPRVTLVEFDRSVALRARDYARRFGLKNYDAIHLASAADAGVEVLYSTDGDFPFDSDVDGVWVSKPYNPFGEDLFSHDD